MTQAGRCPGFSPADPAFIADPYPYFAWARDREPTYSNEHDCWVVARAVDIDEALGDFSTFSNRTLGMAPVPLEFQRRVPEGFFSKAFNALDPPEHAVVRKLGQQSFTRGRMRLLETPIREIASRLVDEFAADGSCELMSQFCYAVSLRTIVAIMDLRYEEFPDLHRLTEDLPRVFADHITPMGGDERRERWERVAELRERFKDIVHERAAHPGDDFVSNLIAARRADGDPLLTDERIATHMSELVFAGTDTTANLIGHMVLFFDEHPDARDEALRDPRILANAIEEGMRRRSPVLGVFRFVTRDTELGGVQLTAGSRVYLALASAGHDPRRFPDAEAFDVERANASKHVTFGKGRHMCLGAPLVRVEAPVALATLYERLPELRVSAGQELEYEPVLLSVMLKRLAVEW